MAIFGLFSPPPKAFFAARTLLKIPLLFEKKWKNEKFCGDFLEKLLSYPEIYFGPPGTIWALRNRILRKKSRKTSQTQVNPPWLVNFVISEKTTQTLSGSVWKFAYGASDSVSGRHRWVRARDRVNEWLTPLVDFIIILACFIIINQRRVISKISKSFVSAGRVGFVSSPSEVVYSFICHARMTSCCWNHGVRPSGWVTGNGEKPKVSVWEFFFDRWKWWIAFLGLKKRPTRKSSDICPKELKTRCGKCTVLRLRPKTIHAVHMYPFMLFLFLARSDRNDFFKNLSPK